MLRVSHFEKLEYTLLSITFYLYNPTFRWYISSCAREAEPDLISSLATATKPEPRSSFWQWGEGLTPQFDFVLQLSSKKIIIIEPEEAEPEPAPSSSVSADVTASTGDLASNGDAGDGRPLPDARRRVWTWISRMVCLHRSMFEDWGITFSSLSGLMIPGRRDGVRENDNSQARQHFFTRAHTPSGQAGTGMDDHGNRGFSCLRG